MKRIFFGILTFAVVLSLGATNAFALCHTSRRNFTDADSNICNFVDLDNDGICDIMRLAWTGDADAGTLLAEAAETILTQTATVSVTIILRHRAAGEDTEHGAIAADNARLIQNRGKGRCA